MSNIPEERLGMEELDNILDDLIEHRFPGFDGTENMDRRIAFMTYVNSFSESYANIGAVTYPHGLNAIINVSYFVLYNLLSMLNRQRGNFLDEMLIRQSVVLILHQCANNNFDLLYEFIFD